MQDLHCNIWICGKRSEYGRQLSVFVDIVTQSQRHVKQEFRPLRNWQHLTNFTLREKAGVTFYFNTRCQPYTHQNFSCRHSISRHYGWTVCQTPHCACMPVSDLTCWQLPNSRTLSSPFLFFWTLSLSHDRPQLALPASWELMLIPVLWFAALRGVLCAHCAIWLAFWVTLQVWGGAGFHSYHKAKVRDRLTDSGYNLDKSSCKEGRKTEGK